MLVFKSKVVCIDLGLKTKLQYYFQNLSLKNITSRSYFLGGISKLSGFLKLLKMIRLIRHVIIQLNFRVLQVWLTWDLNFYCTAVNTLINPYGFLITIDSNTPLEINYSQDWLLLNTHYDDCQFFKMRLFILNGTID